MIEKTEMVKEKNRKTINIVHMFPKLLSLYGEYGNISILKKYLTERNFHVKVLEYEDGVFPSLADVSMVYVGSGTEENLIEANKRLENSREAIKESICGGNKSTFWLSTGNSLSLFGRTVKWKDCEYPAIGAFPYDCMLSSEKRFASDIITSKDNIFDAQIVGFINTSAIFTGIENPLLAYTLGKNMGNDKISNGGGLLQENFWGTQLVGPFMVKNPPVLEKAFGIITGEELNLDDDENVVKAYKVAVAELNARAD